MATLSRSTPSSSLAAFCAALLLLAANACSSFDPEPKVPGAEDWRTLPAEFEGDYFFLPLALDGDPDRVLWFLYDTGASHTVVDAESLKKVSSWEASHGNKIRFGTLECGETKFRNVSARAMSLEHLQHAIGRKFDGILAYSAFADVLLNLDYPNSTMRIAEGHLPRVDGQTVFEIHGTVRPYYDTEIDGITRRLLLDTGSGLGFEVHPQSRWDWAVEPLVVGSSMGIDGLEYTYAGRLDGEAQFFGNSYAHPVLRVSHDTELVGTDLLRDYSITFDQAALRLEVMPASTLSEVPMAFRGTGAIFHPHAQGMEVVRMVPGSPAEKVGMQIGDQVERTAFLKRDPFEMQRVHAQSYYVRRGGRRFQLEVPVVDLIPIP